MVGACISRAFCEECPSAKQWEGYERRFGSPHIRHFSWDLRDRDADDHPACRGEVVILIANRLGHLAYVRKRGGKGWSLPTGRIGEDEGIEEAAVREAWEGTGTMVRIHDSPSIIMATYRFSGWDLIRWHIVLTASAEVDMRPQDSNGLAEARFFRNRPVDLDPAHDMWLDLVLEGSDVPLRSAPHSCNRSISP